MDVWKKGTDCLNAIPLRDREARSLSQDGSSLLRTFSFALRNLSRNYFHTINFIPKKHCAGLSRIKIDLHILISLPIRHGNIIRIIVKRMDMQSILLGSSCQTAQEVSDVFLFLDAQVVLTSAEEDNASLADGDGEIS